MIEVKNISKTFGDTKAVQDVGFTAQKGEIFGLIGPNGAGKTTCIRMIMNILMPDTGAILFDGTPIREEEKERIGYLPEERGLYKKVKVNEMLRYLSDLKRNDGARNQKNIDFWLERFDLTEWKYRKIEELSKGMSQKVQFISSVAHDPELMFFDEPFSGLDPVSSDMLRDSIQELGRQGRTILFSTHIMEHAEKICNRIFIINKGREVIQGETGNIKDTYGTRSVIIEFDGDGEFIESLPMVESVTRYPRYLEARLRDGRNADELLQAVAGKISIRRFELAAPSLHNIFVQLVGKRPEEAEERESENA